MKKVEFFVNLALKKKITVEVGPDEDANQEAWRMISDFREIDEDNWEDYLELLRSSRLDDISVTEVTLKDKVKMVVDAFDPYGLLPGGFAPSDEYNPISGRIAEKIKDHMTKEKIAKLMSEEFEFSFGEASPLEKYMRPAEHIYDYLENQYDKD